MRPDPSNTTVVRFIAFYGHTRQMPVRHILLGFGYQRQGGHTHADLVDMYNAFGITKQGEVYAGYLYVDKGRIWIFSGGSSTLDIEEDAALDDSLQEFLNNMPGMKSAILSLFPLITAGQIQHTMFFQQ
jgi:hypothetical protein